MVNFSCNVNWLKNISKFIVKFIQSCLTLCDSMDYIVHGILQARILDQIRSDLIRSVAQSCPTLCNPMNRSTPGLPVRILEWVGIPFTTEQQQITARSHLNLSK